MGELDLTVQSGENIFGLLIASVEFLLEELFEHVQDFLFEKHTSWIQINLVLFVHTVFKLDSCKRLQNYCYEEINRTSRASTVAHTVSPTPSVLSNISFEPNR
ncbi:8651_t:CDS:2 [Funneliformis mosseae]|uniref:8651_t:CDS:1 n=1 Tax=Funneliformis mosseae TaxID=27381 RepID=A0A9N9FTT6_FUNMO|nr:8651_t:CDS:2 [Funneliformis mosseae]